MPPPLLTLRDATVRIAAQPLFGPIDLAVSRGDRVCLVGRNGAGKSTLLRALAGEVELDDGERFVQPRTTVTYLPQEPSLAGAATVGEAVMAGVPGGEREAGLWRAESVLAEVGMAAGAPVAGLSGGEVRRVSLARALVAEPDVLLLDEPTNHLDIATIEWLEGRLEGFVGAVVTISHDRAFLRRLSRATWWLDRGRLHVSARGFGEFDAWSEEVLAVEEVERARLDKRLEVETDWLHKGVTARRRRNMGRLRRLHELRAERRGQIARQGSVKLAAEVGVAGGKLVIEAKEVTKRFGERAVVENFSTRVMRGDRVGIMGPNGAGKTTLLRLLVGELHSDAGTVRHGTSLTVARFEQDRASLDPESTPWDVLCPDGGLEVEVLGRWRHVVGYLRDFLFRDDQVRQPVKALSGGERNRLLLARILARPANLLVLDEPTNDLDMDTLDLLVDVLADYAGTLLVVSHDRDFLDRLATSTIVHEGGGRWREYAGGYSDWLSQRPEARAPTAKRATASKPRPTAEASSRPGELDTKLERELARLPGRIDAAGAEVARLEERLADPGLYARDPDGFTALSAELERRRDELTRLEERWLELEDRRERANVG